MDKVIFTAFTKGYDTLKDPLIITPGWRYICYTDDSQAKSDIWEIVYIPDLSVKQIRKFKILPPFPHSTCIWIDGSMQVNCNLDYFVKENHKGEFTLMKHPDRNCIYKEAEACLKYKKDRDYIIKDQITHYRQLNYPSNNGMVATGVMIRNNTPQVKRICELWWREVFRFSKRDQLSFNFVAFNEKFQYNLISFDILKKDFILNKHNNK